MARFEMDIDLDDFLWELSSSEKDELVDLLIEDGYAYKIVKNSADRQSLSEWEFSKVITKIADNRLRLTAEEDALLRKIANRF